MSLANQKTDPTNEPQPYAAQLQALAGARQVSIDLPLAGPSVHRAGEGTAQRLPLSATIDGTPMDVLFTVSIGSNKDEGGRFKPVGYPHKNGTQNAVTMAAKNYAVVRKPYSHDAPYLVELTPEELAMGQCRYSSEPDSAQAGRPIARIPGSTETALQLDVSVGSDRWDPPAQLSFQMGPQGDLQFGRYGNPDTYAMVAAQV